MTEPYDYRGGGPVKDADLPEGVTLKDLKAFLAATDMEFWSVEHFVSSGPPRDRHEWVKDDLRFRVALPPRNGSTSRRGANAIWQDVRDWVAKQPDRDLLIAMRDKIADVIMVECQGRYAFGGFDHEGNIDDHGEGVLTFAMEPSDRGRAAGMRERLFKVTVEEIGG